MLLDELSSQKPTVVKFIKLWAQLQGLFEYQDFLGGHLVSNLHSSLAQESLFAIKSKIDDIFEDGKDVPDKISEISSIVVTLGIHLNYETLLSELKELLTELNKVDNVVPGYDNLNVVPPIKVYALAMRLFSDLIVAELALYSPSPSNSHNPLKGYYPNEELALLKELASGKGLG